MPLLECAPGLILEKILLLRAEYSLAALLTLSWLGFLGVERRTDKANQDALLRVYIVQ